MIARMLRRIGAFIVFHILVKPLREAIEESKAEEQQGE